MHGIDEHPLRQRLNAEFHARPPIPLTGAVLITHLAFLHEDATSSDEREHLSQLCEAAACVFSDRSDAHLTLDNGAFQVRWEQHTEFSSYTFFYPVPAGTPPGQAATALDIVPPEWLQAIPGQMIVGTHIELRPASETPPDSVTASLSPTGKQFVVSKVADGAAWVFTDLLFENNFSRFLILDVSLTRRQAGRTVQRLAEIETYRLMALLGLPVAKDVGRWLRRAENELAVLMDGIGSARSSEDEREVLGQLSRLAAEVEHSVARTTFRFGASAAYQALVQQRIGELREIRVSGFPTFREFMERRLTPAMNTCAAMARRQEELSGRVARNSQLLRTRVEIELERQNQELLGQMNRRAKLQLRLQETVEGLSVVAITYYGSQLVHYLAKGTKTLAPWLSPEVTTALAIPAIALLVAYGLRRMRRELAQHEAAVEH